MDLHIEQLEPRYKELSIAEMLQVQLSYLQRQLQLALIHGRDRMIIIHGVGSGVLRDAVHQVLRDTPGVRSFRNEYMSKYGYGATEVLFTV